MVSLLSPRFAQLREVTNPFLRPADWNEEQLAGLASTGNARANAHWLSKPPALEPTDANISDYIKRKYAGEWVASAAPLASPPRLEDIPESPIATRTRLPAV
jgi:hypothetical protein